jgi:hypothetical protein
VVGYGDLVDGVIVLRGVGMSMEIALRKRRKEEGILVD